MSHQILNDKNDCMELVVILFDGGTILPLIGGPLAGI